VDLTIEDCGDMLRLEWTEHGGPATKKAHKEGFGSRLVDLSVTGQLGGSWERRFEPGGLVCDLTVSKAAITP
jgi:two-component sensor histidine kinase